MPAPDARTALIGGPYGPPVVRAGDWLSDEIDGLVEVGGHSNGPIPWPRRKKTGRASLILCGDLVRAVRTESALAIMTHFGVSAGTVRKWRAAFGVDRKNNDGTQALYKAYAPDKLTDERAEKGRARANRPEAKAKMAATKTGKPAHPKTRAALLRSAKASKPTGWGKRANEWMRRAKKDA